MTRLSPLDRATMAKLNLSDRLNALTRELASAVAKDLLFIDIADATLLLAICRSPDVGDVLDTWHAVCAKLRRKLTSDRPLDRVCTAVIL
jgi:hypothetical protein